ncbi:pupal cuticle protein Edg-84A [Aedes albopictus]|uniref:Uncharacterized protein n=1 Tax=Aedes albopictus TaxID=7160 RepID=A0ABM1Z1S9_AEDAL|nr:pupal cuticle protein Edg-84A-like [Aedes albopictus]
MRAFVLGSVLLLASASSGSYLSHEVSSQYQAHDGIGGYSYGYADPNSQKHETKDAHGITHGGYSYVDGDGHVQTVKYTADPFHGFQVVGTNLPKAPAPVHSHYGGPWAHSYSPVVLGHNGAPLETPEVQAAKAAHFAAHAEAKARLHKRSLYTTSWKYVPAHAPEIKPAHYAQPAPAAPHYDHHHEAPLQKWHGPIHIPVIHNGVPVETPEVQHARAFHASAHVHGYAPAHEQYPGTPAAHEDQTKYGPWKGPVHIPVIHGGVPVETPEVQHAKEAHLNALASAHAAASHGPEDDGSYKPELWDDHHYQHQHQQQDHRYQQH